MNTTLDTTVEIPLPPKPGDTWRMNFYAMENNGGTAWSPILGQGNFHKASRFGKVTWSTKESLAAARRVVELAHADGRRARTTISVAFGCPFAGAVDPGRVLELARSLAEAGADEVVFADTIGVGVPRQVRAFASGASGLGAEVGMHFHNTRNTGFANAYAALEAGIGLLDSSVGGTGGCPFAPKATGNIATEDLVYLLEGQGLETGVDLDALIGVADWLEGLLGRELPGQLHRAGTFAPIAG